MNTHKTMRILAGGALLALAVGVTTGCTTEDSKAAFLYERADAYRGGAMWDKWWKVPEVKEGIEPGKTATIDGVEVTSSWPATNPLYATHTGTSTRSGSQTYRCKECHGWDYKGKDGAYGSGSHNSNFAGVWDSRNEDVTDLFRAIRNGEGISDGADGHNFIDVLSPEDIADLVKFVREGTADADTLVTRDKAALGDVSSGEALYNDSCAGCHGADSKDIDFKSGYATEYIFNLAHGNPWETIHKIRFGQPDGAMPNGAVKGYLLADVSDILAYAQSLAPEGFEHASGSRGGVLWDKWWKENGSPEPGSAESSQPATNPLYLTHTGTSTRSGSQTYRCKECHGWDYAGVDGAYGSGSHNSNFVGVMAAADWTAAELIGIIGAGRRRDGTTVTGHAFEGTDLLDDDDVVDLALFVKEELVDDSDFISYETKRSKGSAAAGSALFNSNCTTCHGPDGMRINFKYSSATGVEYVGDLSRDNPFEVTHKVRWGHPGSAAAAVTLEEDFGIVSGRMPSKLEAGYSEQDVANVIAYAQTLIGSTERGGLAWDKWWKASDVVEPVEPGKTDSSLSSTNPHYLTHTGASTRTGSQTYRCKECHGWDYEGTDGAYASGSHSTGFAGVLASQGKDAQVLYDAIYDGAIQGGTNANHAFGALLGDSVTRDLVTFIRGANAYNVELIDLVTKAVLVSYDSGTMSGRSRDADALFGQIKFDGNCAACHGDDGRALNFKEGSGGEEYIADLAGGNPWEFSHKVFHGHPGTAMPNAAGKYYTLDDVADILLYSMSLPGKDD